MDQQLLESFNNLAVALQNLAENLQRNNERTETSQSMIADALTKLDIAEQIKSIQDGVKTLSESNAKIIEQQKDLISAVEKRQVEKEKQKEDFVSVQKKMMTLVEQVSEKQKEDSIKIESIESSVKKKESSGSSFMSDPKQKKQIKDGLKMILMIAAGILAIGLAFKIIGQVDFASVIALSVALPLIAIAFKKISEIEINDPKGFEKTLVAFVAFSATIALSSFILSKVVPISIGQALTVLLIGTSFAALGFSLGKLSRAVDDASFSGLIRMPLVLVAASIAIAASSRILQFVKPISIAQAMTTILIAVSFAILATSIGMLAENMIAVDLKGLLKMPLVLITASLAIAASSYILALVRPVGFLQILSAIGIAATFAVLSFGLVKIAQAISRIDPITIPLLPIVLIAISLAIAGASYLLSKVTPISFAQFMTSLGIAIVFVPMSFALPSIAKALSNTSRFIQRDAGSFAKDMVILLVALATAITLTSFIFIFTNAIPPAKLFNIFLQSLTLSAIAITMGLTIFVLKKLGLTTEAGVKSVINAGLSIVTIAATIAATSLVLALGQYTKYPTLSWVLLSGLSIVAYGALIYLARNLGFTSPQGMKTVIFGGLTILTVAATITATSYILGSGKYQKYPSLAWLLFTAGSILVYGTLITVAGTIMSLTGGAGFVALALGAASVLLIAGTILGVDKILSSGDFSKSPSLEYVASTTLMLGLMGALISVSAILLPAIALGSVSVLLIAGTILGVDKILSTGKYDKYPSLDYAKSTSLLISIFGLTMATTGALLPLIFAGKFSVSMIANAIKDVADTLSSGTYNTIPKDFAISASLLITSFGTIMTATGILYPLIYLGKKAIIAISEGIKESSEILSRGTYTGGPPKEWSQGVAGAIGAFSQVYKMIGDRGLLGLIIGGGGVSADDMKTAILTISDGILTAGKKFSESSVDWTGGPTAAWANGVGKSIAAFAPVFGQLNSGGILSIFKGSTTPDEMASAIKTISYGILASAEIFAQNPGEYKNPPPRAWALGVGSAIKAFAPVLKYMDGGFFKSGGSRLNDVVRAIKSTSEAIVESAKIFKESNVTYSNYPSSEWSSGVSAGIKGFLPLMKWLSENSGFFGASIRQLKNAIIVISDSIVEVAKKFKGVSFEYAIPANFFKNLNSNFESFGDLVNTTSLIDLDYVSSIDKITDSIASLTSKLSTVNTNMTLTPELMSGIVKIFENYESLTQKSISIDSDNILIVNQIANSISELSKKLSGIKPDMSLTPEWITSLRDSFAEYKVLIEMSASLDEDNIDLTNKTAKSIAEISNEISAGNYSINIPTSYGQSVTGLFKGYKDILSVVKTMTPNVFSTAFGYVGKSLESLLSKSPENKVTPESVALNIVSLSNIISQGNYKPISQDWMASVYKNMQDYLKIMDLLSGTSMNADIFGFSLSVGKGIAQIASDFEKLASSIDGVSRAISGIEIEKVTALRALTGSVVLLSLMDSEQFESMMTALEEKSSVLGKVFDKIDGGQKPITATVRTASLPVEQKNTELQEVVRLMKQVDTKLAVIASSSQNISTYVNQLRTSGSGSSMMSDDDDDD